MFSFVRLYSDNVLGMETCGLPDELLTEILGERVQRHLRAWRDSGHLQGCRYNPFGRQCCNTRDSTGKLNFIYSNLSPLIKGVTSYRQARDRNVLWSRHLIKEPNLSHF